MARINIILILIFLNILFSCDLKDKEEYILDINAEIINIKPISINTNKKTTGQLAYSKLISSNDVKYITLETNKESLIGKIEKVMAIENKFYVFDKKNSKGVFVFNENGSFLFKIQMHDNRSGMTINMDDVNYNTTTKLLEILDIGKQKLHLFNLTGKFIKEIPTIFCHKFCPINEKERFFYSKFIPNKKRLKLDNNYRLLKVNYEEYISANFLSFENLKTYNTIIPSLFKNFYSNTNHKILLIEAFNNNIYEINGDSIEVKYKLNFFNFNIRDGFLESDTKNKFQYVIDNKLAFISNIIYEDSKELVFWYNRDLIREVIYNKKTKKYSEYLNYFIKEDNIFIRPSVYMNNEFGISILEPYKLLKLDSKHLGLKIKNILGSLTEISNPILVKINK